eukprot:TRINITY_DN12320_c0_g1_i2.p1 TRINITY_DN12320_c0_g1~~TRINITY_DN12320_c0_g1_i2.p1  ORF type:complete len:266 (-),score=73.33 TRINITY_DN12320_c0_g1_i2:33-830(-)
MPPKPAVSQVNKQEIEDDFMMPGPSIDRSSIEKELSEMGANDNLSNASLTSSQIAFATQEYPLEEKELTKIKTLDLQKSLHKKAQDQAALISRTLTDKLTPDTSLKIIESPEYAANLLKNAPNIENSHRDAFIERLKAIIEAEKDKEAERNRFTKLSKESLTNIAKKLGQYIKKSANTMAENVKQSTIQLDTYYFKMKARNPKDMVMWMQKNKDEFVDKDFIDNLENNIEHEKLQFKEKKVKEVAEDVIDFVVEEFIKEFVAMKA